MKRLFPSLSALVTCAVTFSSFSAAADPHDDLRARWAETLVAAPASVNMNDPIIATEVNAIVKRGQDLWASMEPAKSNRAFLWSGLASTTDSSYITKSYKNLQAIALALKYDPYATTHLSNASQIRDAVRSALDWMYDNRYHDNNTRYDNWFDWEIGAPQALLNIVALMWDDLSDVQRDNYTKAVLAKVHTGLDYAGANGTSQTKIWSLIGVLRKNRNVYSDVSASWARPMDGYLALARAQEWGAVPKLLFGSDYPLWTPKLLAVVLLS